jgi:uncharacterized membrane protein
MARFENWPPTSREQLVALFDHFRASFGSLSALAMGLGLVAGLGLPQVDSWLRADVPLFDFSSQEAARSMLETIATVTVSVAGIAFSVTIVAFTLSTRQLSPRVLRSFRRDLVSQLTLAAFLGTFVYCLAVLARLGSIGGLGGDVPSISIAVAVLLALSSLGLFAVFIGHIVSMLQPSSVIASIAAEARPELTRPFPAGVAEEPDHPDAARAAAERRMDAGPGHPVRCRSEGYLTLVRAAEIVAAAEQAGGLVRQRSRIGSYLLPGEQVAVVWAAAADQAEGLGDGVAGLFETGRQRTLPQDPGFPVRQLADVALKGLSPGINDPTTALNAMEAMTAGLIHFARGERPSPVRLDGEGEPRFLADVPDLDELVELGFEQVTELGRDDPLVMRRLAELLRAVDDAAPAGVSRERLQRLLAKT